MARKKSKRRSYYYARRYKQLASKNYFRVKAEYYDTIQFPQQQGKVQFANRVNDPNATPDSMATNTIAQMLNGYAYVQILAGLFSFYKITSILIEITPKDNTGNQIQNEVDVYLGYRVANNAHMTLQEIKSVNQNLVLDPRNRQRKFFRTLGNFGDWTNTNNAIDGTISLESQNGARGSQHVWSIKVSLYLLYKFSKA